VAAHSYARLYFSILQDARIKPSDKLILLALQKWGHETHECFPSDDTIARQAAIGRRTVQRGLDRLEDFGFIQEVPDTNPTGRKFLLRWLDDPTYLPPLKEKKPRRATKPTPEKTCKLTEDQIREAARKEVRQLAEEGWAEQAVYDKLGQSLRGLNPTEEQFDCHEEAWMEAMQLAFPGTPCPDEVPWKPGDPGQPDQFQVAQWVHVRLGQLIADDPNCDEHETELYSELSKGDYDDDVWSWLEQAIKQASGQTLHDNV
jgi:hypothetical protein